MSGWRSAESCWKFRSCHTRENSKHARNCARGHGHPRWRGSCFLPVKNQAAGVGGPRSRETCQPIECQRALRAHVPEAQRRPGCCVQRQALPNLRRVHRPRASHCGKRDGQAAFTVIGAQHRGVSMLTDLSVLPQLLLVLLVRRQRFIYILLGEKNTNKALAGVAQWIEHWLAN